MSASLLPDRPDVSWIPFLFVSPPKVSAPRLHSLKDCHHHFLLDYTKTFKIKQTANKVNHISIIICWKIINMPNIFWLSYQVSLQFSPWWSYVVEQTQFVSHDHLAHYHHHHQFYLHHPPCCSDPGCCQQSFGHLCWREWTLSELESHSASSWLPGSLQHWGWL